MKVLVILLLTTLLTTKAQEISNRNYPGFNKTQLDHFNRTQWTGPSQLTPNFNRTQWYGPTFNQPQPLNKTQWNRPPYNPSNWNPAFNRTNKFPTYDKFQLINEAFNRSQLQAQNRSEWKLQMRNNSIWNRTQWNHRPRRSDDVKWGPVYNNTWNQTTHNGDVIIGQIGYLDRLLYNQTFRKDSRWWSGREKIFEYPKDLPGKYIHRTETISAIRIYNKFLGGLESSAKILSGGVGFRYVKIELSSPWNRGFYYLVQLFGR